MCFAPQRRAIFEHPSGLQKVARECGVLHILTYKCASRHSGVPFLPDRNFQKVVRGCGVLCILTCKCASRHSGVQFFDIRTSKSAPTPSVLSILTSKCASRHSGVQFFEHQQLQKVLPHCQVFCSILTCKCASRHSGVPFLNGSELQKWLRDCGVLCILTCKCASRHSGVPFFTCLLNSYLRTRRFSEATFRTSGTTNHWKNTAILALTFRARVAFSSALHACGSSF